jgi:diguanylate cyclase (GGDEF)-like protein
MLGFSEMPRDIETWRSACTSFLADGGAPLTPEQSPMLRALRGLNTDRMEVCVSLRARTKPVYLSVTGRPIRDESGALLGAVVTFNDITALREARERVAELAQTDELTGLPNRRAFRTLLSRLVAEAQRGRNFGLVLLDIDHFKRINDSFGHQGGDEVLKRVAQTLTRSITGGDFVGRYGGEEFCALFIDADLARANQLAEQLRREIADMPGAPRITISLGVCGSTSTFRPDEDAVIACADAALYRAKQEGRNRVSVASPDQLPAPRVSAPAR